VRGLKRRDIFAHYQHALSHPVRVRGLKLRYNMISHAYSQSHPVRVPDMSKIHSVSNSQ